MGWSGPRAARTGALAASCSGADGGNLDTFVFADDAVAAQFLGHVERLTRAFDESGNVFARVIRGNAERDGDGADIVIRPHFDQTIGGDEFPNIIGDGGCAAARRIGQDDRELLTTVSCGSVLAFERVKKCASDEPENLITELVSVGVVEILEMIEIRKDERQRLTVGQ
jgi:hypothetical protein